MLQPKVVFLRGCFDTILTASGIFEGVLFGVAASGCIFEGLF